VSYTTPRGEKGEQVYNVTF